MVLDGWEYASSTSGTRYALKEIKKLKMSVDAIAKLELAMERISKGTSRANETSLVRNDVWELRVQADQRWYRLLFSKVSSDRIALLLVAKKRNRLDPGWISAAEKRLREHKRRIDG